MTGPFRKSVRWVPVLLLVAAPYLTLTTRAWSETPPSPKQLKLDAISDLEQISTTYPRLTRTIERALEEIRDGLSHRGQDLFLDEVRILPPPDGKKVFRGDEKAVERLLEAGKRRDASEDIQATFQQVINSLVQADREIAQHSIATAQRLIQIAEGSHKRVAKAQWEFERALREEKPTKAIRGFGEAWETSQEVVGDNDLVIRTFQDTPDPFLAGSATTKLSVTFQVRKTSRRDHERHRFPRYLELVWIVQDSNGSAVRTLSSVEDFPTSGEKGHGSLDIPMTAVWDGRDEEGNLVPSGTYSYVAFGRLIDVKPGRKDHDHESGHEEHKFWSFREREHREHAEAISFPITGTATVIKLAVTITSPLPGSVIDTPTVLVQGTIDALPGTEVGVTVNGAVGEVSHNHFAAMVGVGPEDKLLTATAVDAAGHSTTDSIEVDVLDPIEEPLRLFASPAMGTAPLTVELRPSILLDRPVVLYEYDFDGDGLVDLTSETSDAASYTYSDEGLFFPTVTVTDDLGTKTSALAIINVFVLPDLVAKWTAMKDALRVGDIGQALGFIAGESRERYREIFIVISSHLSQIDSYLTDINLLAVEGNQAEFEMLRLRQGVEVSYYILFVRDNDGVWRLRTF